MINYLVIVEGEKMESKILLSILSEYDINPIKVENRLNKDFVGFDFTKSTDGKVNVYIIQGPMNNITQLPKYYNSNLQYLFLELFKEYNALYYHDEYCKELDSFINETKEYYALVKTCVELNKDLHKKKSKIV